MSPVVPTGRVLWIGTYPERGRPGDGEGVWRVTVDDTEGRFRSSALVAPTPAPSFLALSERRDVLFAVGETDPGTLTPFEVLPDEPWARPLAEAVPSGGSAPCHVLAVADGVWIANYLDGTLSIRDIGVDGVPGPARDIVHAGSGPDPDRQDRSHAHFVARLDGRPVVVDLGTDEIRDHGDPDSTRVLATLPPGTGPRHLVDLGDGALAVVGELDPAVFVLAREGDGYVVTGRTEACAAPPVSGADRRNYPSHVALSPDGRRLYVAVRGADVLSVHAIDRSGPHPVLRPLSEFATGGAWPRHFAVLEGPDDLVVVANQESGTLTSFTVDAAGRSIPRDRLPLPAPACVLEG